MSRSRIYLKVKGKDTYLKAVNTAEETLEFTDNVNDAIDYKNGEWFADTELEFIKFHFKDKYPNEVPLLERSYG